MRDNPSTTRFRSRRALALGAAVAEVTPLSEHSLVNIRASTVPTGTAVASPGG